jgi:hypothetical protein
MISNVTINGRPIGLFVEEVPPEPPTPVNPFPSDMDFVYLANDFDGTQIPNKATGTNAFGPYLEEGTITKNGSGSNCYLSNSFGNNRLYINLTQTQLYKMYPYNNGDTYTFFLRAYQNTSRYTSGIITWRTNGYIYMIRCEYGQLQLHTSTGYNLGSNFLLTSDKVYKVIATKNNGTCSISAKNLNTGDVSNSYTYNPNMDTKMSSFTGYNSGSDESATDAIYGIAGIPRATTAEEDEQIKNYLLSQGV